MWWKSLDSFRLHRVRTKAIRFRICHLAKSAKSSDHPCPHLTLFIGFLIDLFTGRHSAENIRQAVSSILDEYQISDKVHVIVSDNASNMVKAFSVGFSADDEKMVDEEEMWVSGFIVFFFILRCWDHLEYVLYSACLFLLSEDAATTGTTRF